MSEEKQEARSREEIGSNVPELSKAEGETGGEAPSCQESSEPEATGLPELPDEQKESSAHEEEEKGEAQQHQQDQREQAGRLMQALGAALLREQLWQIRLLDPAVQSWEDVHALPQAAQFDALVARGCTPVEAFRAVHFERLAQKQRDALRRASRSGAAKAHLSPIPQAASEEVSIPVDVLRAYQAFFPRWSEAQIRADYRRHR